MINLGLSVHLNGKGKGGSYGLPLEDDTFWALSPRVYYLDQGPVDAQLVTTFILLIASPPRPNLHY